MAKKFVRGVTGIEDIESYDKTLTNVNDIISDGENTYVHTTKGKNEFYYKLTDGVTSVNSTGGTITIEKSDDGNVNLNTNPQKVLQHDNLKTADGLDVVKNGNTSTILLDTTKKPSGTELSTLSTSFVYGNGFADSPEPSGVLQAGYLTLKVSDDKKVQFFICESSATNGLAIMSYRFVTGNVKTEWREMAVDNSKLLYLLNNKQNTLTNNASIGVNGSGLKQLYALKQTYNVTGGLLKTHVKSVSQNTSVSTSEEEFNFIVKINKGVSSVNFKLNTHDTTKFSNIMTAYGENNTVNISGCVFTLSGSTLTVSTTNNESQNYVITFSDII